MFSAAHEAATSAVEAAFASTGAVPREACPFTVTGGAAGTAAGKGDWYYDDAAGTLHIQSSKPMTISTAGQVSQNIEIDAGVKADLTLDGVDILTPSGANKAPINLVTNVYDIPANDGVTDPSHRVKATNGDDIRHKTMLHLTLADDSVNYLNCGNKTHGSSGSPAIRCGWGSVLVIDDSIRNLDQNNNIVTPENGVVGSDVTLINGTKLKAGDPLSRMDAEKPGTLYATGGSHAAGIGSGPQENSGTLIFNGGNLIVAASEVGENGNGDNSASSGAGIGSGDGGSGTITIFNGGRIDAQASYHGAAIGCGWGWRHWYDLAKEDAIAIPTKDEGYGYYGPARYGHSGTFYLNVAGDIYINGGFIRAKGAAHGNAFGMGCHGSETSNRGHIIRITGGTLLPSSAGDRKDIGGKDGYTIVTGGSVNCPSTKFQGLGDTAYNTPDVTTWDDVENHGGTLPDSDKVQMITIDLTAEINPEHLADGGNNIIESWKLYVQGVEKNYGAPYQFDNGKLYLWLPTSDISETISVQLSYIDKNGEVQKVDPLFREPGAGSTLKSYIDFPLPDEYLDKLTKPYDGLPFEPYDLEKNPITTTEDIPKKLNKLDKVTYAYQLYDKREGTPLGPEISNESEMPSNVGVMKFTMTSKQFSDPDPDDVTTDTSFKERYWGHRATGWCEITRVPSKVDLISANWVVSGKPGEDPHDSSQELRLEADISGGTFADGTETADTCKAPEGRVQLYVDGRAVGSPIELLFEDTTDEDGTVHKANATRSGNDKGGSSTHFTYTFTPSQADYLVPDATSDNKHIVSLMYLPPAEGSPAVGNYLESVNPADHPDKAPSAPVAIDPIDPNPTVTPEKDPGNKDPDFPEPSVSTKPDPTPTVPGADPTKPGDKTYTGTIVTTWDEPSENNPHPGRVTLKVKTPSTGAISVTGEDGELYEADFVRDKNGNPVRNDDGTYTLVLDPTALGHGELTFAQEPNGAYTGTTWIYDVTVQPNPKIPPKTSVEKSAENLTHPNGPTQPGDRIRYTVRAANAAAGSAWNGVTITDRLPACLDIDEATIVLENPTESLKRALKTATGAFPALGEYVLSVPDADGRRTITAPAGRVYGVGAATLTFECTVRADAAGKSASSSLANIAEATGTRPDPERPGSELPENPEPSDPATPPKSPTVAPADPQVKISKSVENTTSPDAKVTRVGDVLRYTVALANEGAANSCLQSAVVSDPLPAGLEPVPGSIKMTLADGSEAPVGDAAYDKASRTLAVTAGDLWGGERVTLVFEATVGEAALGANNANIALAHGTVPSKGPGGTPGDPAPGQPTTPPSADPVAFTPPATPPVMVGEDPAEGDVKVSKAAENLTSDDGKTRVGDEIRYTITLRNDGAGTAWMDAVVKDVVPKGLEPAAGTIKVMLPNGSEATVADTAYEVATRTLAVAVGHLYGGQEATVTFIAIVTEDAVGTDIGNVAAAVGDLPSKWDPDAEHPEPGKPFSPPEGWPDYEKDRPKVESPKAYPPGGENVTAEKLAQTEGETDDKSTDSKKSKAKPIAGTKLAQTGDAALAAALPLAAAALVAAGALLLGRRRLNRR
ncbi:isopeptide-forming domain-containing fimbrial protein [Eggerthellaceae bacterium 24-137]